MVSTIYGSLPVVHRTGGLADTVEPLDVANNRGNGFLFEVWDSGGLRWAIDRAMEFYRSPADTRVAQVRRVMVESRARFSHEVTAREYFGIYERMLQRPLVGIF
jgi:glycogen synthase